MIPFARPRQPACTAATWLPSRLASSRDKQSAVMTFTGMPSTEVWKASASPTCWCASMISTARMPCTCFLTGRRSRPARRVRGTSSVSVPKPWVICGMLRRRVPVIIAGGVHYLRPMEPAVLSGACPGRAGLALVAPTACVLWACSCHGEGKKSCSASFEICAYCQVSPRN